MVWVLILNVVTVLVVAAVLLELIPPRLYSGLVRGVHVTIGITTPTDRQLKWTFPAWLVSLLAIVDGMVLILRFVS